MAEREGGVRQRNRADVEARLLAAASRNGLGKVAFVTEPGQAQ